MFANHFLQFVLRDVEHSEVSCVDALRCQVPGGTSRTRNALRHEAAEECIGGVPATGLKMRELQELT
jgi:hypothetical protein